MYRNGTANHRLCAPNSIASAAELASHIGAPAFESVRRFYSVRRFRASELRMDDAGWNATEQAMGAPRDAVENQELVFVRDRHLGHEAVLNGLRSRRFAISTVNGAGKLLDTDGRIDCRWCGPWHVRHASLWADEWGPARSADHRVGTRPNWARQSTISGLVFGDESMHRLDRLTDADFVSLFETARAYIERSLQHYPRARYFMVFLNGGPKSASSVEHAHLQVVGREDGHFAYPETIASRCPEDYWSRLGELHRDLGLAVSGDDCAAWASLAPVKERDVTAVSQTLAGGARFVYRIWKTLASRGTKNFSLAAILSPAYLAQDCPERFARWPNVVWRFVDRGDSQVKHGDIGTMELFGSSVVGTDPFEVARWLREV